MTNDNAKMEEQVSTLISCVTELKEEVQKLKTQLNLMEKPCYTNEEVLKIFGVTQPTLRKWRNEGQLGYTQIGSTLLYSQKDIADFLKTNHFDAYAANSVGIIVYGRFLLAYLILYQSFHLNNERKSSLWPK